VLSRLAGRFLVSPAAFLLAGIADFSLFGVLYVRWRLAQRRGRD
jgi:hypothetical protein